MPQGYFTTPRAWCQVLLKLKTMVLNYIIFYKIFLNNFVKMHK